MVLRCRGRGPAVDRCRAGSAGSWARVVLTSLKKRSIAADMKNVRQQATSRDEKRTTMKTCGFVFTTTGRPCGHHVSEDDICCRAGHPCAMGRARMGPLGRWTPHRGHVFPLRTDASATAVPDRRHRAALLLAARCPTKTRRPTASAPIDSWPIPAVALALLGSPDAAPEARDAVIIPCPLRPGLSGARSRRNSGPACPWARVQSRRFVRGLRVAERNIGRRIRRHPQWLDQLVHPLAVGEELGQLVVKLGITRPAILAGWGSGRRRGRRGTRR